jgi:hypothetical protein
VDLLRGSASLRPGWLELGLEPVGVILFALEDVLEGRGSGLLLREARVPLFPFDSSA